MMYRNMHIRIEQYEFRRNKLLFAAKTVELDLHFFNFSSL
jgi:hypothetical protein